MTSSTSVARRRTNCDSFFFSDSLNLMICPNYSVRKHFTSSFEKLDFCSLLTIDCISDNEKPFS